MKKSLQILFVCLGLLLVSIKYTFAQKITVGPDDDIVAVIRAHQGDTIVLLRGVTYYPTEVIQIVKKTVIMGESEPSATMPAVIIAFYDPGQAAGTFLFKVASDLTISNIGMLGHSSDGQEINGPFSVEAANVAITLDKCNFQQCTRLAYLNYKDNCKFITKNCIIYNLTFKGWDNWRGEVAEDGGNNMTYHAYNTTYVNCNVLLNTLASGPTGLETMEHNTYVNIFGEVYYPTIFADGFIVKNNIYYNPDLRGYVGPRASIGWAGDFIGDFPFTPGKGNDSLMGDIGLLPMDIDISHPGTRNVAVTNNLRFYDDRVIANQKEAHNASIEPFINDSVRHNFALYGWTLKDNWLWEEGVKIDPMFRMGQLPDEAYANMFAQSINRRLKATEQAAGFPFGCAWFPNGETYGDFVWPMPFDLKPMNSTIWNKGSDGYPLGDLNWFGPSVVDAWEKGLAAPDLVAIKPLNKMEFSLKNYPNPSKSSTTFSYMIPNNSKVSLKVYNSMGKQVATIVDDNQTAGKHEEVFNTSNLSKGLYIYKIQAGKFSATQKLVVE